MKLSLCEIRTQKGYTQNEVAEHCGISTREMNELEAAPGKMSATIAIKLRRLYGIPIDYISV